MVVKNDIGEILASKLVLHKDVASSFVAEALACSQAVQLGVNIGLAIVRHSAEQMEFSRYLVQTYPKNNDLVAHTVVTESLKRGDEVYLVGIVLEYVVRLMRTGRQRVKPD
ncbi:hypothetical protein Goarm_000396 [Gossypium armourianum]|uniref:Uncharacterized protein n=1 Tax=Gossypium armourianum TaxID=34283 RepID=A0A7J9K9P3_9ROSI|nr:hypothetical protein [Gossypium armourianum]